MLADDFVQAHVWLTLLHENPSLSSQCLRRLSMFFHVTQSTPSSTMANNERMIQRWRKRNVVIVCKGKLTCFVKTTLVACDVITTRFSPEGLLFYYIVLRADFAGDGHFVWAIMMKYFYNPSHKKEMLWESLIILPDSYCYWTKQGILIITNFSQNKT